MFQEHSQEGTDLKIHYGLVAHRHPEFERMVNDGTSLGIRSLYENGEVGEVERQMILGALDSREDRLPMLVEISEFIEDIER